MNDFTYENQGTNTYLVYTLKENASIDTMSLGMITNNKIPGIANTVFMQSDKQKFIKYNVSSKVSAKQFFTGAVNKKRLLGVFKGIVDAMLSAEEYMIDHNMIILDLDYIYADVSTCETVLICIPVLGNDTRQMDLGMFFKTIMFSTQFDQTENCDHVAKIINYLNSTPQFSLTDFQQLLDSVEREMTPSFGDAQSRKMVQQSNQIQSVAPVDIPQATQVQQPVNVQTTTVSNVQSHVDQKQQNSLSYNEVERSKQFENNEIKKESVQGEKPMSMFYLLQHYNKENAATYKAQKEAKKAEKEQKVSDSKKAKKEKKGKKGKDISVPSSMKVPGAPGTSPIGMAIPGQPVMPPSKTEQASVPVKPDLPVQNSISSAQNSIPTSNFVQAMPTQMPQYTQSTVPVVPTTGFGETTVLNTTTFGETTVLSGELTQISRNPYLIRSRNNEKILLNKPVFRIGKERTYVDYFIGDNPAISRSHASVITREGKYFIVDTNSTNHTFVNGTMINSNEEVMINDGDKVRLANEDFEFLLA